jgi:hypothetical protein
MTEVEDIEKRKKFRLSKKVLIRMMQLDQLWAANSIQILSFEEN